MDSQEICSALSGGGASDFLPRSGDLPQRIAAFDWASTPLGPIDDWRPSLRAAVGLMLRSPVPMLTLWGEDGIMIYNEGYAQIAGQKHPGILGGRVRQAWPEVAEFNDHVMRIGLSGSSLTYCDQEMTIDRGAGCEQCWFDLNYSPIADACGVTRGVIAIVGETTAKVMAERKLRVAAEALARMNAQLESRVAERTAERDRVWANSRDLLLIVGNDGVFRAVNPAWTRVLGHAPDQVVGRSFRDFLHSDDMASTQASLAAAALRRTLTNFEICFRHIDGNARWISWNTSREADLVYAYGRDVTDEKLQAAALAKSEACLRTIFETSFQLQCFLAVDGTLLDANATALAAIGCTREAVAGGKFWDTPWFNQTTGLSDRVRDAVLAAASGESRQMSFWVRLPAGMRFFEFSVRPLRGAGGEVIGLVPEAVDTTERMQAEDALRQSQKMEAVGQLTGGIAHDFNNLLTGVIGSLELLNTRIAQGRTENLDRYITAAQSEAARAASLTHRLLAFSRRQTLDPKPIDANSLIASMEELIRRAVGPAIHVELLGADGLWITRVDPNQLENALLNLCINARDAMPAGGRIVIETANEWIAPVAAGERDMQPGEFLSLSVSDTGSGMSPDVVSRAFDPFFTTKPIGQGTGLGLSMTYGFVRQSGGQVHILSTPGQGTRVCLYLPRHHEQRPIAVSSARQTQTPRIGAGETVLIVDDEPAVRTVVAEVLGDFNYATIEAADGEAGLRVLRSDARVDLLVTDVGLPGGVNGRQLADAARESRPHLKVLFITGYAENAVLGNGRLDPGMHVMTKPFAIEALAGRIGAIIGAG